MFTDLVNSAIYQFCATAIEYVHIFAAPDSGCFCCYAGPYLPPVRFDLQGPHGFEPGQSLACSRTIFTFSICSLISASLAGPIVTTEHKFVDMCIRRFHHAYGLASCLALDVLVQAGTYVMNFGIYIFVSLTTDPVLDSCELLSFVMV